MSGGLIIALIVPSQSMQRGAPARNTTVSASSSNNGIAEKERLSPQLIEEVFWWFPEDTQTVSVVRGPFKITAPLEEPPANITALEYTDLSLRMAPLGMFYAIDDGSFLGPLLGRNVSLCVEGSRRFRPPKQLGQMLYEGCDINIFQEGLGPARASLIAQLKSKANKVLSVAGAQVMVFEKRFENDTWTILVAMPTPTVLLCATNLAYLTQVLNRMHQKGNKRALPDELPEWKYVNTTARFWALRHYDKNDAPNDPSSPLSGELLDANWPDKQAVGIVFSLDPAHSNVATIKYLSANKDALMLFNKQHDLPNKQFHPVIRESTSGVIEMLVSLDSLEETGLFLLVLLSLLGHAVYL